MRNLVLFNRDNVTGIYPNLSRAYEIALLGNFRIKLVKGNNVDDKNPSDADLFMLSTLFDTDLFIFESDESTELHCIYLTVEITSPYLDTIFSTRKSEGLDTVIDRVMAAKENVKPDFKLTDAGKSLLKTAWDRLDLDLMKLDSIAQVSQTISQLHGSKEIKLEYLAEAIQYHSI